MAKPFSMDIEQLAFGHVLNQMAEDVKDEQIPTFLRKTMFEIVSRVIKKTPVDTGRARGGWLAINELENVALDVPEGNPSDVASGRSRSTLKDDLKGAGQFIEITNAVKYIVSLEFGSSQQAPGGMVRTTLREMASQSGLGTGTLDVIENIFRSASIRGAAGRRGLPG